MHSRCTIAIQQQPRAGEVSDRVRVAALDVDVLLAYASLDLDVLTSSGKYVSSCKVLILSRDIETGILKSCCPCP